MATETALSETLPDLPPAPPRESLIATAVKFLQNSKVSGSPLETKKQFLTKKGLTDEEIQIAITRSGIDTTASALGPVQHGVVVPTTPPAPVSTWSRIREYSAVAIVVGGVVYALYHLYKKFIEPFFMKMYGMQDQKLQNLEDGVETVKNELGQNMHEIQSKMDEIQDKIDEQSTRIGQVAASVTTFRAQSGGVSDSAIGELKAEITSIKGLLLSRNQFPLTTIPRPVIPSWQMKPPAESDRTAEEKPLINGDSVKNEASVTEKVNGHADEITTPPLDGANKRDPEAEDPKSLTNGDRAENEATAAEKMNGHSDEVTTPPHDGALQNELITDGAAMKNVIGLNPERATKENLQGRTES